MFKALASWGGFRRHFKRGGAEGHASRARSAAGSAGARASQPMLDRLHVAGSSSRVHVAGSSSQMLDRLHVNLEETRALEGRLAQLRAERSGLEKALAGAQPAAARPS